MFVPRDQDGVQSRETFIGVETMNWKALNSFRRGWVEHGFKTLVNCKVVERRREERRLAERCATKHQFQAIKSCIADARNYRVARKLPSLSMAHFD